MTDYDGPPAGGRFMTTRWSLVLAAGRDRGKRSTQALASLCDIYWPPVYSFIRRQGHSADEAGDLTQEFFARVLEKNYFQDADPNRGKFRSFLSAAVRHFLSNERDRARALKRGGPRPALSLDAESAEGRYLLEPRDELTPERLFDYQWGLVLIQRVLSRLREEHAAADRLDQFDRLKGFLTGESEDQSYRDAGRALDMTEGAVKVAVHRLRRRYRDLLVDEIGHTVASPDEIDAEIRHLLKAVSL